MARAAIAESVDFLSCPHLLTTATLLLALTGSALAEQLKVVSISDGDAFT